MSNEKNKTQDQDKNPAQTEEVNKTGGHRNASANQDVTTDADNDSLTTGRIAATERSSASSTKNNVAGTDLDGQTSF